jgi:hypothetical protein
MGSSLVFHPFQRKHPRVPVIMVTQDLAANRLWIRALQYLKD